MERSIKINLLKVVVITAICFAVHILAVLFSSLFVNHYIINTRLANFTIYDGYADFSMLLAYIPLSALLVFNKIKGNFLLIALSWFLCFLLINAFVTDIIAHYQRFYVKTNQNGAYSFEVFKNKLASQWDSLLFEFSNLGQFLSFIILGFHRFAVYLLFISLGECM